MGLKKKKLLLNLFLAVVCVVVILCLLFGDRPLRIAALALCIVYGAVHSSIWRCPYCGSSLGRGKPNPCPNCELELEY